MKAARPPITDRFIRPGQFVADEVEKSLVALHHTVGGTAASTLDWWNTDKSRVATSFVVERNGVIYRAFPEECYAWHLGQGVATEHERRSIGIEIASEGGLTRRGDELFSFDGRKRFCHISETAKYYDAGQLWRGYRYFDVYDPAQVESVLQLVDWLCDEYDIPRQTPADHTSYSSGLKSYRGVIGHHHVRPDKSDIHAGFPWAELERVLARRGGEPSAPHAMPTASLALSHAPIVFDAWTQPGPNVPAQLAAMQKLRSEWPSLGRALDALAGIQHVDA